VPGHWIAVLEAPDGARRAVVFFGVRRGRSKIEMPLSASTAGIVEGYLIAPLDLADGMASTYGWPERTGVVVRSVHAPIREASCDEHERWPGHAGRAWTAIGMRRARTFSHPSVAGQDLTLIGAEAFGELSARASTSPWPTRAERRHPRHRPDALVGAHFHHRRRPVLRARWRAVRASRALTTRGVLRASSIGRHPRRTCSVTASCTSATRSGLQPKGGARD